MPLPAIFADLRLPVVAAPMFLSSSPELAAASRSAGIVGTFPALNQRSTAGFDEWLHALEERAAADRAKTGRPVAPLGVNLIVHKSNPRVEADLTVLLKHRVPLVITSLGAAREVVDAVHSYGGLVFHDVTTPKHAKKALEASVDGLIAVTAGAGGHAGTLHPFALIAEIRKFFEGTLVLAGCISTGRDVAAAQLAGADLAYVGTRLLATEEALAAAEYKQMLVDASAGDIVYTPSISSIPASFLRQSIARAGLDPDRLAPPERVDLSHITEPHRDEPHRDEPHRDGPHREEQTGSSKPKAWRDIWSAGQGVASIDDVPSVATLVDRMEREYVDAIRDFEARRARIGRA